MIKLSHTLAIIAYNQHDLTLNNIHHLISLGYRKNILLFDNGSSPSYEHDIDQLGIRYQREEKNIYVNPAWNKLFTEENCNYLTLLNNDCFILSKNYFNAIINHMHQNDIGISSCKTKNIVKMNKKLNTNNFFFFPKESQKLRFVAKARRQGWLMTLNLDKYKKMDFHIPDYLKIWYGDDWIWGQFILNEEQYGVYKNRYAVHKKASTIYCTITNAIYIKLNYNDSKNNTQKEFNNNS